MRAVLWFNETREILKSRDENMIVQPRWIHA